MTWEVFYFVCFLVGFLLSLLTFVSGTSHLHLPHGLHFHGLHGHGVPHAHAGGHSEGPASWLNFGTITAFLAWFGGTGYLLTRYSTLMAVSALALSAISGIAGAQAVFWFVFKVLLANDRELDPADYNMIGVLGRVISTVREGGTGEMIFSREGARRCLAIRSEQNRAIAKDTEVVVMRYEKGIAYVRPWDELSNLADPGTLSESAGNSPQSSFKENSNAELS